MKKLQAKKLEMARVELVAPNPEKIGVPPTR